MGIWCEEWAFVAIYAAYLEETIDSLLKPLVELGSTDQSEKADPSQKIKEIKRRLQTPDPKLLEGLSARAAFPVAGRCPLSTQRSFPWFPVNRSGFHGLH